MKATREINPSFDKPALLGAEAIALSSDACDISCCLLIEAASRRPQAVSISPGEGELAFLNAITTAPALTRYQQGRGIDPSRRELVGDRPANWIKQAPTTVCEHCGMTVRGKHWAVRQHQQTKRCFRWQLKDMCQETVPIGDWHTY